MIKESITNGGVSKVGIYLGTSPLHARNIALVLNMETGTVSPQFHVQFDKSFSTITGNAPPHHWLAKVGLHNVHASGDKPDAARPTSKPTSQDTPASNKKRKRRQVGGGRDKPATSQRKVLLDTPLQPKLHKTKENYGEFPISKH